MHFADQDVVHFTTTNGKDDEDFSLVHPGVIRFSDTEVQVDVYNEALIIMLNRGFSENYFGRSTDMGKISLLQCSPMDPAMGMLYGSGGTFDPERKLVLRPRAIIKGDVYVSDSETLVSAIQFKFRGIDDYFGEHAFGVLLNENRKFASVEATRSDGTKLTIPILRPIDSILTFRSFPHVVLEAKTSIGYVRVINFPQINNRLPSSVTVGGNFYVRIEPVSPVNIFDCPGLILDVKLLFDIITGSTGRAHSVNLEVVQAEQDAVSVDAFFTGAPEKHEWGVAANKISGGSLQNYTNDPKKFKKILVSWLRDADAMRPSRRRFNDAFRAHRLITADRVIASANLFDLLPSSRKPPSEEIVSEDLLEQVRKSHAEFRALPPSEERDSFIKAVTRAGQPVLKSIVRWNAKHVIGASEEFPDMYFVIGQAVDCRNYFVHGGDNPKLLYHQHPDLMYFFANTLEFVFGASELIRAGWDMRAWMTGWQDVNHPWFLYYRGYTTNLQRLRDALAQTKRQNKAGSARN